MKRLIFAFFLSVFLADTSLADASLFQRLGERAGIDAFVARTIDLSVADPRIASTFENTNIKRLQKLLGEQICQLAGGPCVYSGRDMRKSHAHLKIKNYHFNALVENLQTAMDEAKIPFSTQNELLAVLAPMQREVTDSASTAGANQPAPAKSLPAS